MSEALILEFTGVGEAEYAAVNKQLGIDMETGQGDDGTFMVSEVWASRADQEAFMAARLGAALAAGGVTSAPKVRWVTLLAYSQPGV